MQRRYSASTQSIILTFPHLQEEKNNPFNKPSMQDDVKQDGDKDNKQAKDQDTPKQVSDNVVNNANEVV